MRLRNDVLGLAVEVGAPTRIRLEDRAMGRALLAEPEVLLGGVDGEPSQVDQSAHGLALEWAGAGRLTLVMQETSLSWRWEGSPPVWLPFLHGLVSPPNGRRWRALPPQQYRRPGWPLPLVAEGRDGRCVTVVLDGPWRDSALLLAKPGLAAPVSGELRVHDGGWPAAFAHYRARLRARLDLSLSQRPGLAWVRRQVLQHFTFLYGAEVLDLDSGSLDAGRLLALSTEFGGFDAALLWLGYPRLGLDGRTQWELYDDLPGGRGALRALAAALQHRGVRVLLPYLPWDRDAALRGQPGAPDSQELARLVADIGADGVFLDTLGGVPAELRDALPPDVGLIGENRAAGSAFEAVTASWDQPPSRDLLAGDWSAPDELLPSVDLGRFVVPEHPLFAVNRHTSGRSRLRMLRRALFGGTGVVVWQDVFGLALPYGPAELALLRAVAGLLRDHRDAFTSPGPTPLVDTLQPGVSANAFPAAGKRLWTVHNGTASPAEGPLVDVQVPDEHHLVALWSGSLPADEVGVLVEFPRLLAWDGAVLRVSSEIPEGTDLELRGPGRVTTLPPRTGTLPASGPTVARLVADGVVLDRVVLA